MTQVTMMGNPIEVSGNFPKKGEKVTALTLTNKELADVTLDAYAGKRKVLNIFPSIDTGVCATSVRKFNQQAANLNNAWCFVFPLIYLLHKHDSVVQKVLRT